MVFTDLAREYYGDQVKTGHGTREFESGASYTGDLVDSQLHGVGTMTYANGDKYTGDWARGKRVGEGVFTSKNGKKYVGQWKIM